MDTPTTAPLLCTVESFSARPAAATSAPRRLPSLPRRHLLAAVLTLACAGAVYLLLAWQEGSEVGGQRFAEPFRIAGNVYYVGASDIAAFLVAGPAGHVLIDGGYPRTPELIMRSIARLGFRIEDVKVLLNSEPHYDHAGGLAALQAASGADVWASEASAAAIESGGYDRDIPFPLRAVTWANRYPAARVTRRFRDGDTLRVGSTVIIAHVTGGHTRGCTSYEIPVRDGDRALTVVSACSLVRLGGTSYPGQGRDFPRTFERLRAMDPDIWFTSHARLWGRYRKFVARDSVANPVDAMIDREGFRAYVDSGEARFRRGVTQ